MIKLTRINLIVEVRHEKDGRAMPIALLWEDGRRFVVDRVIDISKAASRKAGGVGIRYLCKICGKEVALFDEEGCWFMENFR